MTRSQFLKFIIWVYQNRKDQKDLSFPDFMKSKIVPLVKTSKFEQSKADLKNNEQIQELLNRDGNSYCIHSFVEM